MGTQTGRYSFWGYSTEGQQSTLNEVMSVVALEEEAHFTCNGAKVGMFGEGGEQNYCVLFALLGLWGQNCA